MFDKQKESIKSREDRVRKVWQSKDVFKNSLRQREESPRFITYDGPPFATGLPHYGHLLAGTIKDVVPRYKTMKGFYVPRRFGWDTHGLPIEMEIEKKLGLKGAGDIERFGIAKFNEECRSIVMRYSSEWQETVHQMGRWVDFEKTYMTMHPSYMESVWFLFSMLWEKGLVYEGFKVMPFSAAMGTPLSNFEANLNYKDVDDPSVVVEFPLEKSSDTSILVWTTTPWTLPSNLALMVGDDITYVKIQSMGKFFIICEDRASTYFKDEYRVIETFKGSALIGKTYVPIFDYFKDHGAQGAFRIISDESVGAKEGTGIVHAAPAFGETDFYACSKANIEIVCPVNQNGHFTEQVSDFQGVHVKDADKKIIKNIKDRGRIFYHGTIRHRYPYCWRSDTPLIYKAVSTWFINVEKIKADLLANNKQINWVPSHLKEGRFGKWLENARDWAISRNRYWGTPIPIWKSEDGEFIVVKSKEELEELSSLKLDDLHRHFIDEITFTKKGKKFTRVKEVFDCWFESGSMPYAQNHYPFKDKERTPNEFPADFIAEGLDQTRAWFYTLNIISTALFNKPAFKNVVVNGIVLAENGAKMSKRLKNYPDPKQIINKFGADSIRLYLLNSPAVLADDIKFCEKGVELTLRQFIIPLWNSYLFLATYAGIYRWKVQPTHPDRSIDKWILSCLQKLIVDVEKGMDQYQLSQAVTPFVRFIDQLTNWYIRRSRSRFWAEDDTQDRRDAFYTLYYCLKELSKVAAPFVPFLSDAIYMNLRNEKDPISVHLCDFPKANPQYRDIALEEVMSLAQKAVSMGHSLRKNKKIKVRQPLQTAYLISSNDQLLQMIKSQEELIINELNVKSIVYESNESAFVELIVKPNFKTLGKKVGPLMKKVQAVIALLDPSTIDKKEFDIYIDEVPFRIEKEDIIFERKVKKGIVAATENQLTVALDLELDETLKLEGLAREIVNKVNTSRREMNFDVVDRIKLKIDCSKRLEECILVHKDYLQNEVLATEIIFGPCNGALFRLNDETAHIEIIKI